MNHLTFLSENQFVAAFISQLRIYLGDEYLVYKDEEKYDKIWDIIIQNKHFQKVYLVEVKGRPGGMFPPEIVQSLKRLRQRITNPNTYLIVFSISNINPTTKSIFFENNINLFEYKESNENLVGDFINFINDL
jgi:hypothetical protein